MNGSLEIITICDEILQGQVVNTNASFIGQTLTAAGISVGWMTTIGDQRAAILEALARAASRAQAVIITGGLGPTPDDFTKPCLVEFFCDKLVFREDLLARVRQRFAARGVDMPPLSRNQAEFPAEAQEIPNPLGTAVGIHYARGPTEWFALPGVHAEMRAMMESYVLPRLQNIGCTQQIAVRLLRTTGIGESFLLGKMARLPEAAKLVEVAFLPGYFGVDVKLTARESASASLQQRLDQAEALLRPDIAPFLYGRGGETLPEVVARLARGHSLRIALAESCTGGLLAKLLTDLPGASEFFERGVVCYSNAAKTELLGVPEALLAEQGAVSEAVAEAMAQGLLARSPADLAVAVTGIAGPGGGSANKPVGLTYIALADKIHCRVTEYRLASDRDTNRLRAAAAALRLLHDRIKELDSPR